MQRPVDSNLYQKIKLRVKTTVARWPSAYASGQVVQQYKRAFAKKYPNKNPYTTSKSKSSALTRWYKEKWVDLCRPIKKNKYATCGRGQLTGKYPFCRPSKRVSKNTPMTVSEITKLFGKQKLASRCNEKQQVKKKTLNNIKK